MTATFATQIEIDSNGVAWVSETNTKVVEIVLDKIAWGSSPEEIHLAHPHLSLAQIHAALTWYYENQESMDREIRERKEESEKRLGEVSDPEFRGKLARLKRTFQT